MKYYRPPKLESWKGRDDGPNARRFHQAVRCVDLDRHASAAVDRIAIVGFACDAGIKRNHGRVGAAEGPVALRSALAKIPLHMRNDWEFLDVGDIICVGDDLEVAQQSLAAVIVRLVQANCRPIVLGGGHEVAWAHYQGLVKARPEQRIGIVNFDAHFDLRPLLPGGKGSSGSSFLQIAQERASQKKRFDYLCLGIQKFGNTAALFETARELGVITILSDVIQQDVRGRVLAQLDQLISVTDSLYVTLCMDVFAAAFAPGVSAPQPLGLSPQLVLPLLLYLAASGKVAGFDIAEVSPALDHDGMTAALGAMLIAQFIHSSPEMKKK